MVYAETRVIAELVVKENSPNTSYSSIMNDLQKTNTNSSKVACKESINVKSETEVSLLFQNGYTNLNAINDTKVAFCVAKADSPNRLDIHTLSKLIRRERGKQST